MIHPLICNPMACELFRGKKRSWSSTIGGTTETSRALIRCHVHSSFSVITQSWKCWQERLTWGTEKIFQIGRQPTQSAKTGLYVLHDNFHSFFWGGGLLSGPQIQSLGSTLPTHPPPPEPSVGHFGIKFKILTFSSCRVETKKIHIWSLVPQKLKPHDMYRSKRLMDQTERITFGGFLFVDTR